MATRINHRGRNLKAEQNSRNDRRVLVALPAFNEADSVESVLRAVRTYASDILVVNDGSTDGTGAALDRCPWLRRITHERNLGYGQSLIDAFAYAMKNGFEWVITIDCDHQHEPSRIPVFRRAGERNAWDIISGSRYLRRHDPQVMPPPERVAINRAVAALLNRHLNMNLTDAFCGFKAYRCRAVAGLALSETGYGLPLQLWIQASRTHLRIREVPVPLIYFDPRRSFAGELKDPRRRLEYYRAVIERELGYEVGRELEGLVSACGEWRRPGLPGVAGLARAGA